MFWSTLAMEEREIDKKLKAETPDLRSILEDMHCLQEIRNSNEALMNFLKREENVRTLIETILFPVEEEFGPGIQIQFKDRYKFMHHCCDALTVGAREFYPEFAKQTDLVQKMANFLGETDSINPLMVSYYSKVVINFLSQEPENFLTVLEESNFLENCMEKLENSSMFELLCTIANATPDSLYREKIKQWYVRKGFAQKLIELLAPNQSSSIHENVALLWTEFVRSLREYQYNVEQIADPLLDSIQSEETIGKLLKLMFPQDGTEFSPSVVANVASVLNVLLETNQVRNSPSQLIAQDLQGQTNNNSILDHQPNYSFNSTTDTISSTSQMMMDPKRVVETCCAEHASDIINCVLYGLTEGGKKMSVQQQKDSNQQGMIIPQNIKKELAEDEESPLKLVDYSDSIVDEGEEVFYGDVLRECMQLLINLTNTNFLPTHLELLKAFSTPETALSLLFQQVRSNPARSIFNAQLETLVLHILYSNTGASQRPLIDFVIKDFNLPAFLIDALPECNGGTAPTVIDRNIPLSKRMWVIAERSFFMNLAKRLLRAQQTSPNGVYIEELMKGLPVYEHWVDFCSLSVQSFIDQNRSEKVNSISTTRNSNAIEIDELPDDPVDTQGLYGDFQELKLDPLFSGTGIATTFSPKTFSAPFLSLGTNNNKTSTAAISPKPMDEQQQETPMQEEPKSNEEVSSAETKSEPEEPVINENETEKPPQPLTDIEEPAEQEKLIKKEEEAEPEDPSPQ